MSLINEALKKAQKQRTGETPSLTEMPAVGGESAARIARRGQPAGFNSLLLRLGLGVAALAVVIVGAVLILRRPAVAPVAPGVPPPAASVAAANPPAAAQNSATTAPASAPVSATEAPAALVVPGAPPTTVPAPTAPLATTVVFPAAETPKPAETAPIQLAPAPTQPAAPAVARKLDPRAINYINSIRVAGIRASANDSKVLMNDRVYRIGDVVEAEMGLKLAEITPSALTFEDENGAKFTRNF